MTPPSTQSRRCNRRAFLAAGSAAVLGTAGYVAVRSGKPRNETLERKALIAITLDMEMSRNFPNWEDTHWDYEKGNLNAETKRYTVEACRRVKAAGGVVHLFAVGQTFEQPDVDWLVGLAQAGHPIGNHTWDHVNVLATRPEDIQFRFRRRPELIAGRTPEQVIIDNIRRTTEGLRTRISVVPVGFRTPGGFANGLADRPDVRRWLRDFGFTWVSSKYPRHPMTEPGQEPTERIFDGIVAAQREAQPFVYPDGLVEIPMSPVSDINAFRTGQWRLEWFLRALTHALEDIVEKRGVFDFLGHPSCLYVVDPEFRAIERILEIVRENRDSATIVGLDAIATRARFCTTRT
jgi:hypothetical protein